MGFWQTRRMNLPTNLDALSPDELRTLAAQLMAQVGEKDRELRYRQAKIDQPERFTLRFHLPGGALAHFTRPISVRIG